MRNRVVISAKNLNLNLGGKQLLEDLCLDIYAGQVTALLGPNGAGKSSLLKILSGEIKGQNKAETIYYFEKEQDSFSKEKLASHLAVLPQSSSLSFAFSVSQVVELGLMPLSVCASEGLKIIKNKIEEVGLTHLYDRLYPSLSGGEKQRVHLARVLTQLSQAKDQAILMLDEPTSALDLAHQHNTLLTAQLMAAKGAAVIVVLHDLNLAAQYADRILLLNKGKIQVDGTPWQALTSEIIEDLYGYKSLVGKHPIKDHPVIYAS